MKKVTCIFLLLWLLQVYAFKEAVRAEKSTGAYKSYKKEKEECCVPEMSQKTIITNQCGDCPAGKDGKDGVNGTNGTNGVDGINGTSCTVEVGEETVDFLCGNATEGVLNLTAVATQVAEEVCEEVSWTRLGFVYRDPYSSLPVLNVSNFNSNCNSTFPLTSVVVSQFSCLGGGSACNMVCYPTAPIQFGCVITGGPVSNVILEITCGSPCSTLHLCDTNQTFCNATSGRQGLNGASSPPLSHSYVECWWACNSGDCSDLLLYPSFIDLLTAFSNAPLAVTPHPMAYSFIPGYNGPFVLFEFECSCPAGTIVASSTGVADPVGVGLGVFLQSLTMGQFGSFNPSPSTVRDFFGATAPGLLAALGVSLGFPAQYLTCSQ